MESVADDSYAIRSGYKRAGQVGILDSDWLGNEEGRFLTRTKQKSSKTVGRNSAKEPSVRPKSDAFDAIHSAVRGLCRVGAIEAQTMREFDEECLVPVPQYGPGDVLRIRRHANVSQAVLAVHMNVSVSTVQKWEAGAKAIKGAAAKLLSIIERKGIDAIT